MNRFVLLLAGSTLIFGSASAYLWREGRAENERNATLEARIQQLETQLTERAQAVPPPQALAPVPEPSAPEPAPAKVAAAPKPATSVKVGTGTAQAVVGVGGNVVGGPTTMFRGFRTDMNQLMKDPEYREAMRSQQRMSMNSRYPDLGEALRLPPEEVDKLLDLLTDQEIANMSRPSPFADGQPVDSNSMRQWREKIQQEQREQDAALANVLGANGLQEWKNYQQTLGARMEVKQLRTIMDGSSDPLRPDQVQSLVDAIAAEQRRPMEALRSAPGSGGNATSGPATGGWGPITRENQTAMMEQSLRMTEERNQRIQDAVAPYLSSRQLEQFTRHQKQQLDMQRASLRMMKAAAEAEARGDIPRNNNGAATLMLGTSPVFIPAQQ